MTQKRKLENVVKVISATSPSTLNILEQVYGSIVKAGLHHAPSIKVAEAARSSRTLKEIST